jgi:hypothetical protein
VSQSALCLVRTRYGGMTGPDGPSLVPSYDGSGGP